MEPNRIEHDLVLIHRVMTHAIQSALNAIDQSEQVGTDPKSFALYLRCLLTLVHEHHTNEETIFFPGVRKLMPSCPFDLLNDQHKQILKKLDRLESTLPVLEQANGELMNYSAVRSALVDLAESVRPHFSEEETRFCCGDVEKAMDRETEARFCLDMAEHGKANSKPPQLLLPFLLYNSAPDDRQIFIDMLPWFVRKVLIGVVWRKQWRAIERYFAFPPQATVRQVGMA
jgi:hemerythrin-like domain-containing protein